MFSTVRTFIIITTLSSIVSLINGQIFTNNYNSNNNISYINNLKNNSVVDIINKLNKIQLDNVLRLNNFQSVREYFATAKNECTQQLDLFQEGIQSRELWAIRMLDASSKIPSGIFNGNNKDLGMYDECLSVRENKDNFTIRGRHCMYTLSGLQAIPHLPFTLSVCLPATCSPDEVKSFLQSLIKRANIFVNISGIEIQSVTCSSIDPKSWSTDEIIALSILGTFIGFLVIGTISDIAIRSNIIKKTENGIINGLAQFSFYSNSLRILSTKTPKGTLPSIAGLRFFSMAWVVLGHNYITPLLGSIVNFYDVVEWIRSWHALYILIAPFAVDSFFVMSGFLTAYLFLKEMSGGHSFNIITYYLHRYLRLTPAVGVLIILSIYIFPHWGNGALWEANMNSHAEICSKSWWRILLYIQNYSAKETLGCLGHTWYLSVDMHFFWLSPIVLYPLAKRPKIGLWILSIFLVASVIIPAVIANKNHYSGALLPTNLTALEDMMENFYIVSHTRAGPWLMGVFCGYKVHTSKGNVRKLLIFFGWILAITTFLFSFFAIRIFQGVKYTWNESWETFYAGFSRHIWSFGVCWIIYASYVGYGGIIQRILSLPIFLPLSRISYCIYLVHYISETMKSSALRVPGFFSDLQMINLFLSDFVLNILAAFVFTLCFESPFLVLEKMILGGRKRERNDRSNFIQNEGVERNEDLKNGSADKGVDNHAFEADEASHNYDKPNSSKNSVRI